MGESGLYLALLLLAVVTCSCRSPHIYYYYLHTTSFSGRKVVILNLWTCCDLLVICPFVERLSSFLEVKMHVFNDRKASIRAINFYLFASIVSFDLAVYLICACT